LQPLIALGLKVHRSSDFAGAERIYRKVLGQAPDEFNALHLLGIVKAQQRRFEESRGASRQGSGHQEEQSRSPEQSRQCGAGTRARRRCRGKVPAGAQPSAELCEAHYNLGRAKSRAGDLDSAVASYRTAIGLRPNYRDALFNLAELLR
jgi:protein O-GlcNAc transferase